MRSSEPSQKVVFRLVHLRSQWSTDVCQAQAKCAEMVPSARTATGKGTRESSAWWRRLAERGKSVQEDLGEAERGLRPRPAQAHHASGRRVLTLRPRGLET